jgi:hypothetical protein
MILPRTLRITHTLSFYFRIVRFFGVTRTHFQGPVLVQRSLECQFLKHHPLSAPAPQEQEYDENDYSNNEKYFCDSGCGAGDPAEHQQSGNDGDDEKYQSPVQHQLAFMVVDGAGSAGQADSYFSLT